MAIGAGFGLVLAAGSSLQPATAQTTQSLVADMLQLQQQVQALTGQVQELEFRNRQLQEQLERAVNDLRFRMSELEGGRPASSAPAAPGGGAPATLTPPTPPASGGLQPSPSIGPTYDRMSSDAATSPYAGGGTLGTMRVPSEIASADTPTALYNFAYSRLETGDFAGAQQAFQQFLSRYPSDSFAPNAHFWLGETYYERQMFTEAASSYAQGYQAFPASQVARDTLFKLGMSLARMGRTQDACVALGQVRVDFPDTPARVMSIVDQERQRLGCA